jgi:cytoplasmic tRNA 2-thiolation protein 2
MCSIVEDDFGDDGGAHAMVEDPKTNGFEGETCKKCNAAPSVIKLDFKHSTCMSCFLLYVRHKFRAALGSTKVVRRNSKVLVHFTGGVASVCLMDMIRIGFEQETHKRLCFEVDLVYVDENCVGSDGQDAGKRLEKVQEVAKVLEQFPNFECFYTTIGGRDSDELLDIKTLTLESIQPVIENEKNFMKTFTALKSLSSKQDHLSVTRNGVLRHVANSRSCQYIFISDIALVLATRLLTNISLGRGSSTANDVAFCDDRIEEVKIVRPLRDLSEVEVTNYVKFLEFRYVDAVNFGDDHGQFASIQNLTSKFINGLQQNFSSTVSTVYRTCSKIAPGEPTQEDGLPENLPSPCDASQRCVMCKSYLDYHNSETLFAIEFSRIVAESAGEESQNLVESEGKASDAVDGGKSEVRKNLCHGCRNIFIGLGDEELGEIF